MVHYAGSVTTSTCSSSSGGDSHCRSPLISPAPQRPWASRRSQEPPYWLYPIAITALVLTYMVLGALVLRFIESHQQNAQRCEGCTDVLLSTLWSSSQQLSEEQWRRRARKQLRHWIATQREPTPVEPQARKLDVDSKHWAFTDSLYCVFSSISTIGWGNVAPESAAGRAFLVVYMWIGIPLFLILVGQLGALVRYIINSIWKKGTLVFHFMCGPGSCAQSGCLRSQGRPCCVQCSQRFKPADGGSNDQPEDDFPVFCLFLVFVIYIMVGAILIKTSEPWTTLDAIYYSHVSFSTIGYGDLTMGDSASMIFFYFYITFGIVVLALCFQIVQDTMDDILSQFVRSAYRSFCPTYGVIIAPPEDMVDGQHTPARDKRASVKSMRKQRGLIINSA